jgi:hypothetical protein
MYGINYTFPTGLVVHVVHVVHVVLNLPSFLPVVLASIG